jgi:hypothetical protein
MRHADFLGQQPDARACLRTWGVEIDFPDELIDLVSEDVLAMATRLDARCVAVFREC